MFKKFLSLLALVALVIWKWDELRRIVVTFIGDFVFPAPDSIRRKAPSGPSGGAAAQDEVVYVMPSGSSYHRAGCRSLSSRAQSLSLQEAKRRHTPCKRCMPQ